MNNPFTFFDKIYCINLDHRHDRWEECCEIFNKYEILNKVERFSALKFSNEDVKLNKTMGQIGCSMSHFEILKKAKKENLKNYLVFEDDFSLEYEPDILFTYLNKSISDLPDNWDMFYLGCNLDSSYGVFPIEKWSPNLYKLNSCHTTHAFSVNNKIYDLILEKAPSFENESIIKWYNENTVIDIFFSKHILSKNKCFISNPLLSLQRPSFSNIEQTSHDYKAWMIQNFETFKNKL